MTFPDERRTGRTRHRLNRFSFGPRKLIYQIEITYTHTTSYGGVIECETRTIWRDATVEDM